MAGPTVKAGTKEQRLSLAKNVIQALSDFAYPFGGYLRDEVRNEDFEDIDFFMPQGNSNYAASSVAVIRTILRNLGYEVTSSATSQIYAGDIRLRKNTLIIKHPTTKAVVSIDLVKSDSYGTKNPFTSLDADVNVLWYNKISGNVEVGQGEWNLETVKRHIRDKVYETPTDVGIRPERAQKLAEKGYKSLTKTVSEIQSWCTCESCTELREEQKKRSQEIADAILAKEQTYNLANTISQTLSIETDKKETTSMTTAAPTFMETFKKEATEAAYRSTGTQMTAAVKKGIIMMMKDKGASGDKVSIVSEFFESDAGTALISAMLGHGLPHAPMIGEDPRIQKLSGEFRVAGYSKGMDVALGAVMQYVLPGIMEAMANLPPIPTPVLVSDADMKELERINASRMRVAQSGQKDVADLAEREAMATEEAAKVASKQARV